VFFAFFAVKILNRKARKTCSAKAGVFSQRAQDLSRQSGRLSILNSQFFSCQFSVVKNKKQNTDDTDLTDKRQIFICENRV
jgi:hypothetical protein